MAKNNRTRKPNSRSGVEKPDGPLVIYVGYQGHGGVYELGPLTESRLEEMYPQVRRAAFVNVGYPNLERDFSPPTADSFAKSQRGCWLHVAEILTGLPREELAELGVTLYDPETERVWELALQPVQR